MTAAGCQITETSLRVALRNLAREWRGEPQQAYALATIASPSLPQHTRRAACDCLDCLWDEFRGALAMLDGLIDGTAPWQDIDPEYGHAADPAGDLQIDLEMQVNGLLHDLIHGVRRKVAA